MSRCRDNSWRRGCAGVRGFATSRRDSVYDYRCHTTLNPFWEVT
jgi:hypothetical protein